MIPNNLDPRKYRKLIRAEQIYQASGQCPPYQNAHRISFIADRFLTVGSTTSYISAGKIDRRDWEIEHIVQCGYGSALLRKLAEKTAGHKSQRKNHICLFTILSGFIFPVIENREFTNYIRALRFATFSLFNQKVHFPSDLQTFLELTKQEEWDLAYQKMVYNWYTNKSKNNLELLIHCFPLSTPSWSHKKILDRCAGSIQIDSDIQKIVEEMDKYHLPQGSTLVEKFGVDFVIENIAQGIISESLTVSEKTHMTIHLLCDRWQKNASSLETLLIRKKYEANYKINPDMGLCSTLKEASYQLSVNETYSGPKICVIPCVFESENRKVNKVMLQTVDLTSALLEDLLRNHQSKIFTSGVKNNKKTFGFFSRHQVPEKSIVDIQKERFHPARVIESSAEKFQDFECFVILAINGTKLPYEEIKEALKIYRFAQNFYTKLIIVGVGHLENSDVFHGMNDILMINGVDEGTFSLLTNYFPIDFFV